MLVYGTAMTNVSGDTIQIGSPTTAGRPNAGYGGLFWRGPRAFTNGTILAPQGKGRDEIRVRSEDFAAVCPAPFFSEELPFLAADTLHFRYAVLVADGLSDDNGAAGLAAQATKALAAG